MINTEAFFSISYGLYIVSTGSEENGNGFVSNTFFQVSSSPAKFAACCSKDNYSLDMIRECGNFSVSVLQQEADAKLIGKFGYKSGRDLNKMEGLDLIYGDNGVPIVLNDAIAYLECKVVDIHDVGSHLMFIGEVVRAEVLDREKAALTYKHYRDVKKGLAPRNAPTYIDKSAQNTDTTGEENARWECAACGYVYDEAKEGKKFTDLPDNWVCPTCGSEKDDFYKL